LWTRTMSWLLLLSSCAVNQLSLKRYSADCQVQLHLWCTVRYDVRYLRGTAAHTRNSCTVRGTPANARNSCTVEGQLHCPRNSCTCEE
jgi:hypothetical protein